MTSLVTSAVQAWLRSTVDGPRDVTDDVVVTTVDSMEVIELSSTLFGRSGIVTIATHTTRGYRG